MACAGWTLTPNATFSRVLILRDADKTELNLTGYNARMDFKEKEGLNETVLFSLTDGDGLTLASEDVVYNDPTLGEVTYHNGIIRVTVSQARAELLAGKKGVTDLLIESSGTVTNLYKNPVKTWYCTKGVTDASF